MFLAGLQQDGVPLKFSSWHWFTFSQGGASSLNLQIQERSRSVKSIFAVVRRSPDSLINDSGAFLNGTAATQILESFQFRIGGRYFPAQPVPCGGNGTYNGASPAYVELQKALNQVGDYRLSTSINECKWATPYAVNPATGVGTAGTTCASTYQEGDGQCQVSNGVLRANGFSSTGQPFIFSVPYPAQDPVGSQAFIIATSLETSSGQEVSGLNAEEQSDISLILNWSGSTSTAGQFNVEVYTYYDAMIVLRENNVMNLVQ